MIVSELMLLSIDHVRDIQMIYEKSYPQSVRWPDSLHM